MSETRPLLDILQEHATPYEEPPLGLTWGFRAVHPDLRSRDGFRYPWPGVWAKAPDDGRDLSKNGEPCPSRELGGLCAAKTAYGAGQGGIPLSTVLLVGWTPDAVLGEDDDKVRVARMWVHDVLDVPGLARAGNLSAADLSGANLYAANLSAADLSRANLPRANLSRANLSAARLSAADLSRANLSRANLSRANLSRANLSAARLSAADLSRANLPRANLSAARLSAADLSAADLSAANLYAANLPRANLSGANLSGANLYHANLYGHDQVDLRRRGARLGTEGDAVPERDHDEKCPQHPRIEKPTVECQCSKERLDQNR